MVPLIRAVDRYGLLAAAEDGKVWDRSAQVDLDKVQQAFDEHGSLPDYDAEKHLNGTEGLDRFIAEVGPSTAFADRFGFTAHAEIDSDRQRPTSNRFLIGGPVLVSAGAGCWFAHACQKPRLIH